jgi:hypothetical protein
MIACTTIEELRTLAPFWDRLRTYMDAPYGSYPWALSSAGTLTFDGRLFVPLVVEDRTPIAAALLVRPRNRLAAVRQLGVEWHGEPGDFNYRDDDALRRLCESLAARRVPLLLARVPAESPVVSALRDAYGRRGRVVTKEQPSCPYLDVLPTEEATIAGLPSRLRSDLRRAARRAHQTGDSGFEHHSPGTEQELRPLWDQALSVEAAGWKGRRQSALAANAPVSPFYKAYADRACSLGTLRILLLKIGGETASMMIAVEQAKRLWVLKIGYDERFSRCSPGMLILEEGLRYAARQGLHSYEFLGADASWTRRWTDLERQTVRVFACPYSFAGAAAATHLAAGRFRRRLRDRLEAS